MPSFNSKTMCWFLRCAYNVHNAAESQTYLSRQKSRTWWPSIWTKFLLYRLSISLFPLNKGSFAKSSASIHPKDHISIAVEYCFAPNRSSGALNQLIIEYHLGKLKHLSFSKSFSFTISQPQLASILQKSDWTQLKLL